MHRAPNEDEVEINIFGPGYGECCLVHIGGGQWIVIDSCVDTESGRPVALAHLERVGVDPAESVKLIVASHWHDDHIRGLSSVLRSCVAAKFCASSALSKKEFIAVLKAYGQNRTIRSGSGAREIIATLAILKERNSVSHPIRAIASKLLFRWDAALTGHGQPAEVWSLSPSDGQYEKFLVELGSMLPSDGEEKLRLTSQSPNHLSVVTWLSIGSYAFLFGADLEEVGKPDLGWSAIALSETRPFGRALFFKIPHHGSQTAHHADTWRLLVEPEAVSVLTPWNKNRMLPSRADVERLLGINPHAYSTSNLRPEPIVRRPYAVEKQIKETAKIKSIKLKTGHVQLRGRLTDCFAPGSVSLSPHACSLADLLKLMKGK
jgi:beta-lactamase superfamily II metal-dependent hydrolase